MNDKNICAQKKVWTLPKLKLLGTVRQLVQGVGKLSGADGDGGGSPGKASGMG